MNPEEVGESRLHVVQNLQEGGIQVADQRLAEGAQYTGVHVGGTRAEQQASRKGTRGHPADTNPDAVSRAVALAAFRTGDYPPRTPLEPVARPVSPRIRGRRRVRWGGTRGVLG